MLSRVANSIHWMARYVERAENVARFIDVNYQLALDMPGQSGTADPEQWQPLVITTGDEARFKQRYPDFSQHSVIQFLTFDRENPNSLLSCLAAARENARTVREGISSEMWEQLNLFYLFVRGASVSPHLVVDSPQDFFAQVKQSAHLFNGVTDATMTHGEGWHFARMGRLLERADKTSRILDVKYYILLPRLDDVGTPFDNLQWAALLKSASAYEMYRKRFQSITPERVAEFLILDRDFPRSLHHCLIGAEQSLHAITGSPTDTFRNLAEQRLGRLRSDLRYAQIEEVISVGLHEYLDTFQTRLNQVGDAIYQTFFAMRPVEQAASPSQEQSQRG